jgi:NAD-dependent SIR2 family protein deacetylase
MPIFLDTESRPTLAIAVCDRCHFKYPWDMLMRDGNQSGLMVCQKCRDPIDPYRLPPPPPDRIGLKWARPDVPISATSADVVTPIITPSYPFDDSDVD